MPTITGSLTISWDELATISDTQSIVWNELATIHSTRSIVWNENHTISSSRLIMWLEDTTPVNCPPYPASNRPAFKRVYVDHLINGPSRIFWDLDPRFNDPAPYTYQLQVAQAGVTTADWINVGDPVVNSAYLTDTAKRLFGMELTTHYRIQLTTNLGTYYSQPQPVYGNLNKRDWLIAREITRKELLRFKQYTGINGWLLKAKRSGEVCPCVDPDTGEVTNEHHSVCYGTGFVGGYYQAIPCVFFDISPDQRTEGRNIEGRGMIDDTIKQTRWIGYPQLYRYDLFVEKDSDERYYVNKVKNEAELRGVPIVVATELRLAPFTDVAYTVPLYTAP